MDTARITVSVPTAQHLDYKCLCVHLRSSHFRKCTHACCSFLFDDVLGAYVRKPALEFDKLAAEKMHGE